MVQDMNEDLKFHIRSFSRFVYVVTEEEDRFLVQLRTLLAKVEKRIHVYNSAFGLQPIGNLIQDWSSRAHKEQPDTGIHQALITMYKDDPGTEENFYVITDPERWLQEPQVVRRLVNLAHQLHNNDKIIKITFFVGPKLVMPQKLQRYIEVVHDKGPDSEEIKDILANISRKLQVQPSETVVRALQGLTSYEVDAATSQSIIATKKDKSQSRFDVKFINDYKKRQLRKTNLVNYVDVANEGFDKVGGLARFKSWVEKNKAAWTREGQKFGLKPPKGVLMVGVWGCGKSISVKALGNAWNLPVIQLDLGKLRQSGVGDSEANVFRAINLIESVAPCVTGETEVTLADGTTKPIASLWQEYLSDPTRTLRVKCWNEKTLKVETTSVRALTLRRAEAFRVTASNGFYLNATGNHQNYVMRGGLPEWVQTDDLIPGDMLAALAHSSNEGFNRGVEVTCDKLLSEVQWVKIQSIESVGQCDVYDLACEGDDTHSFIANGLITHNCVVWVDEAEKSLAGGESSAQSDAGTTSRMIGALSTWVQETKSEVCLAMTVNRLKTLPVEFVRRMDERFFFDLPSEDERIDILKIHLLKKGQDPKAFNLAQLAEDAKLMVGSEIEHALGAAMTESFHAGKPSLDEEILSTELKNKPRIFKTLADEMKEVLDWVGFDPKTGDGIRARFASETKGEGFRAHQTNG